MKKVFIVLSCIVIIMLCFTIPIGCKEEDRIWYHKDFWTGNYSEVISIYYSEENVSDSQLYSVSPNGEREVQFEIILILKNDETYYLSKKIINSENKKYDFVSEGEKWYVTILTYYEVRESGAPKSPDKLVKEIRLEESRNTYYQCAISKYGGLYFMDEQGTGSIYGLGCWVKIF